MKTQHLLIFSVIVILFSSCFSQHAFQTARTTKVDNFVLGLGGNIGSKYEYTSYTNINPFDTIESTTSLLSFTDVLLYTRTGLFKNQDIGLTLGLSGIFSLDYKYMLLGDYDSPFVISSGLNLSTNAFASQELPFTIGLPLHLSYYIKDEMTFFITSRYSYQFKDKTALEKTERSENVHRLGISGGIEVPFNNFKYIVAVNSNHALNTQFIEEENEKRFYSVNMGFSYTIQGNKSPKRIKRNKNTKNTKNTKNKINLSDFKLWKK